MNLEVTLSPETIAQIAREAARLVPQQQDDRLRVYGLGDLADRLGVSPRTANYVRAAYPEYFIRIGKSWAITANQLARMLQDLEDGVISLEAITRAQPGVPR
jgi:hypothetical protein